MKEGPMKEHIERGDDGVVKSLYITYRKKDGMLVKETTVRQFYDDNYRSCGMYDTDEFVADDLCCCLLYTSPSPRDRG